MKLLCLYFHNRYKINLRWQALLTQCWAPVREYELLTEAHAKLSVVRKCSKSSVRVCLGEGNQLAGGGWSAVAGVGGGGGRADSTQGERIWSSFQRQKVKRGLLLLIHILWPLLYSTIPTDPSLMAGFLVVVLHCPKSCFPASMGIVPVLFKKISIQQHPREKYL